MDRAAEAANPPKVPKPKRSSSKKENDAKDTKPKLSKKRKSEATEEGPKTKKLKIKLSPSKIAHAAAQALKPPLPKLSITLKLGPRPVEPEAYPCCLCVSMNREGLLRVYDPPVGRKDAEDAAGNPKEWMAHEYCANVVPETWVDEIEIGHSGVKEKVVFGIDGIVKDRWHLVRLSISAIFTTSTNIYTFRNVRLARRIDPRRTAHLYNVRRGNARRLSMSRAQEMGARLASYLT